MQGRPPASAPINIGVSPSTLADKIAHSIDSIDSIFILNEGVEETYDTCKSEDILYPNIDYLAIDRIKTLISQVKNIFENMNMDSMDSSSSRDVGDVRGYLTTIRELFEYGDTPSRIFTININTLRQWCIYWLVPRFKDYDSIYKTQTLLELMVIIDPEVAKREQQRRQQERQALLSNVGGKKKYLRLKQSSRRNKSHRKNKRRRVFRVKKSYKNKKYIK